MKRTHILGLIIIALAIGAIMSTVADSSTYVSFTKAELQPDKEFHVVGKLDTDHEIHYDPETNANRFVFHMLDNDNVSREVVFRGSKPQDFERSEQIVITGKMDGSSFDASKILMKCPSKYNSDGNELQEYIAEPNQVQG